MAIKTSTFGGVTLTGKAAQAFRKQFLGKNVKHNPLAQASFERGKRMQEEYQRTGRIEVAKYLKAYALEKETRHKALKEKNACR